jgi:non-specific serine/threonine protein kinase
MSIEQMVADALADDESIPQARDTSGRLTQREEEVAALVARGCSNRQVADALVIATSTAERHVANILAKLGLSSRAQLAVWTVERGRRDAAP